MRMTGLPYPITSYVIPPAAPAEVAEAWRELQRIGALVEDTKDDLSDARAAVEQAKAADVRAIVTATTKGTEVKDPQQHERKALAEVSRLGSLLRGYQQAADEAGNALASRIDQHREEWAESLIETREAAAARYDAAIAEAKLALSELIPAQGGVQWVEQFDLGQARTGQYTGFAGGRLKVHGRGAGVSELRKEYSPGDLLTVAALATVEPKPKELVHV